MIRKYIIVADDSIKGFDDGITKLEREWGAEEIEPCDDCISRTDILEFLKGFEILHSHDELRSNLIYGIMSLPSVQPPYEEVKKNDK